MGFISFSLNYYRDELQKLECAPASPETIYRAQQLLKMIDDLLDEGYTELNDALESSCNGVSRLKNYLKANHTAPFSIYHKKVSEANVLYEQNELELESAINELIVSESKEKIAIDNSFLAKLIRFCEWIGYEKETAYVFLLRDTLLPYIHYLSKNRTNIYPWLLGRKTLTVLTGEQHVDDEIRASVIKALEFGKCDNYEDFCKFVLPNVRTTLNQYPQIIRCFSALLRNIKQERIVVVESGCSGTFPMLLKSLDDRVDIRMYTTYPYLLNIYGDRIFTPKYEEKRLFESLSSQNLYFRFSDLRDNCFYVRKCRNDYVKKISCAEVDAVLNNDNDSLGVF